MFRQPLPKGKCILMKNQASYVIDQLVGRGGFSLVYLAHTEGGTESVVVKEFYPASTNPTIAVRNSKSGKVEAVAEHEEIFKRALKHFEQEGSIGGAISANSFQTIAFQAVDDGYAILKKKSEDMCSLSDMVKKWKIGNPIPYTGDIKDKDPFFVDLVRVGYALRIVDSLLAVVQEIHQSGYLHLDLSSDNVIWAGADHATGRNCSVFVSDYGSALSMVNGSCPADAGISNSQGFSAPELVYHRGFLTPSTDVYSVGQILFFLCCGDIMDKNVQDLWDLSSLIEGAVKLLKIPEYFRQQLVAIISKATVRRQQLRYLSALDMQAAVQKVINQLPLHPVNPDNEKAFTLYSLKSMLMGSLEVHYNWAVELADRRSMPRPQEMMASVHGLTQTHFYDDEDFLKQLFPPELHRLIDEIISSGPSKADMIRGVMSGNYDVHTWQAKIIKVAQRHGMRGMLNYCNSLLTDRLGLKQNLELLFDIMKDDAMYLRKCMQRCNTRDYPQIGLAMLAMYALLGKDGFCSLVDERDSRSFFRVV